MEQAIVRFRGKGNGIEAVLDADASFEDIKTELRKKLAKNQSFLGAQSDIQVSVITASDFHDDEKIELTEIFSDFFKADGIEFIQEKRPENRFFNKAKGLFDRKTKQITPESGYEMETEVDQEKDGVLAELSNEDTAQDEHLKETKQKDENIDKIPAPQKLIDVPSVYRQDDKCVFIKSMLRNGQRLNSEGNVIVMGDVNPGAQIVAGGNIVVLGTLRGVAHAGAWGDQSAIVFALNLQPTQLRIANIIAVAPADVEVTGYPEVAQAKNGKIVIEPYED